MSARKKMYWRPKEDITTWELAMALNVLLPGLKGYSDLQKVFEGLPQSVARHFQVVET